MKKVLLLCVCLLAVGTSAYAATVWNPAANGISPPDTGDWGVAANWTAGVPTDGSVTTPNDGKAVFNVPNAAECVVSDAQALNQLVHSFLCVY